MKTKELISFLSKGERSVFELTVIKKHKRKTLRNLFEYIKRNKDLSKEKLYQKTFGDDYDAQKDHLLRNELRLLNQEIELFLVQQKQLKKINLQQPESQLSLLEIYYQKQQYDLFEQGWKKLYKKAKKARWYPIKIKLVLLLVEYETEFNEFNIQNYIGLDDLLEEAKQDVLALGEEQYQDLAKREAFVNLVLKVRNPAFVPKEKNEYHTIHQPLENQNYINYLKGYAAIYNANWERREKIKHLKKLLELQAELIEYKKYKELEKEKVLLLSMIAVEHFLLDEFVQADDYYQSLIPKAGLLPTTKKIGIYFNYFSNLIGLEQYTKAIDWYEEQEQEWQKVPNIKYRILYLLTWAYLTQEEYDKAYELLVASDMTNRPEGDLLYARFLLAIVFFSRGDAELAEREVYNIKQRNNYQTPQEENYKVYANLFYTYIKLYHQIDKVKRREKAIQLQEELDRIYEQDVAQQYSLFFYRWLMRAIRQIL